MACFAEQDFCADYDNMDPDNQLVYKRRIQKGWAKESKSHNGVKGEPPPLTQPIWSAMFEFFARKNARTLNYKDVYF